MSKKQKFETDSQLLARYKAIEADKLSEGKSFDFERELCTAMAHRDYKIAEKKLGRQLTIRFWGHHVVQLTLIFLICINWEDLKIVLVLLLVMLWRSLNYNSNQIRHLQARTIEWLAMAHPTAKDDFFSSEHCYGTEIRDRVYNLLHPQPR